MKGDSFSFEKRKFDDRWLIPEDCTGELLIGGISGDGDELYYLVDFGKKLVTRCKVITKNYRNKYADYLRKKMTENNLPYGVTSFNDIIPAFMQPHEALKLKDGRIAIAMHNADYIRIIDFVNEEVGNFPDDDKYSPVVYSATNSVSAVDGKLYFAQWNLDERINRYCGSDDLINITVKSISNDLNPDTITDIAIVHGIEGFHEVKISPDNEYVLLTEFCLQSKEKVPNIIANDTNWSLYDEWKKYEKKGLLETKLQCINMKDKSVSYIIPKGLTPGHVEFSLKNPNKFYLSCHSMSKANNKIILHTQGVLEECEISSEGVRSNRIFTTPDFLRLTSHKVFEYNGQSYIAITVYPNYFYVFKDDSFAEVERVKLFECLRIDISHMHFCTLDERTPLWLDTSDNGRYVILISQQLIYIYDLKEKRLSYNKGYNWYNDFLGTAHVTNMNDFK